MERYLSNLPEAQEQLFEKLHKIADIVLEKLDGYSIPTNSLLSDIRLIPQMIDDYREGYYKQIPIEHMVLIGYTFLYLVVPKSVYEELLGEKTMLRTSLLVGASIALAYREIQKYKVFLEEHRETTDNEFGTITVYTHRVKGEDNGQFL